MVGVIIDLHLGPGPVGLRASLAHGIKNPAIGSGRDFPFQLQVEVLVILHCSQIHSVPGNAAQYAIFADPIRRERLLMKTSKSLAELWAGVERGVSISGRLRRLAPCQRKSYQANADCGESDPS